jgi:general secretion pathway protein A
MAPSSSRFYGNRAYEKACNTIVNGIRERRGLILLTGESGTGKTTIVQQAIDRLDKDSCSVLFCSFHPALDETLSSLCQHVGLSVVEQEQQQKAQQLNQRLLARSRKGKSTAFVVDDAHTLDARTLAQILSMADRTLAGEHLLQVVLVGLPELDAKLHSPICRPSLPTAFPSTEVRALPPAEVAPFIEHQLKAAATNPRLAVTAQAMERIAAYSKGIPREINALCGLASVIANLESSLVVTEEMIEEIKGERALWGVGIEAETTTPSTEDTSKTQVRRASVTPWTSVHPTVYPPQQRLKAVNDGDGSDTSEEPDLESSPTWVAEENGMSLGATPASPMTAVSVQGKPEEQPLVTHERWVPSWGLTGSALAFSVLFLASALFWEQLPFSGNSPPSNATGRAETRSVQDNPEAEIEFAQMRPVITGETTDPIPPNTPDMLSPSRPAIAPSSAAKATAINAEQQPPAAKVQEKSREVSGQTSGQPMVALSKPETTTAAEQPEKETPAPTIPAPIAAPDPDAAAARAGTAGKPEPSETDNAVQTVVHAKPAKSIPPPIPEKATSAAIKQQPSRSPPKETALPSILDSVDSSGYQSMENEVMDQVTAQMLPVDPKQIDLPGFREFLFEDRQPGAAALSGPAALGSSALPLNPGSLSTFSGR